MFSIFAKDMKRIRQVLSDNFLLIGTFICFLCSVELLRVPIYGATFIALLTQVPGSYDFVETLIRMLIVIADAAVLSLPVMFVSRRRWIAFLWIFLFDLYCLVQTWYITVYQDVMPFSHFLLFENVNSVLLRSVAGLMSWRDLLLFLPLAAFIALSFKFRHRKKYNMAAILKYVATIISLYIISIVYNIANDKYENRYSKYQQYLSCYLSSGYICDNGFIPFVIYSFCNTFANKELSDDDYHEIETFLNKKPDYTDNGFASGTNKNLILIIVESLNSWYLERSVCGVEITPNINRLIKEKGTISALHVLPQVRDGRSSDGQFCYATGLLPLKSGSVSITYSGNRYPSLCKALKEKGYSSFNMVCDNGSAWNQQEMSEAIGFDRFYDKSYNNDSGSNLNDSILFINALSEIKKARQPFFAQIVTISTHQPGEKPANPSALSDYPTESTRVTYGMEGFHKLDAQIGEFIQYLKTEGIFDNTIIVIASDHDEVGFNEFEARRDKRAEDSECAFIAINCGQDLRYDNAIGQIDIYPTLLDIMGCNDYYWKGLGHSILRAPKPDYAYSCTGASTGNQQSTLSGYYKKAWDISELIIKGNFFNRKK